MSSTPSSYPPPQAAVPLNYASAPAQQYKLFSPAGVGLATFLGSPVAGSILMSLNYRRMGRPSSANKAILLGALATVALMVLACFLPSGFPGIIVAVVSIGGMVQAAKTLQGPQIDRHQSTGGKSGSLWTATAIGLGSGVIIYGLFVGIFYFYAIRPVNAVLSSPHWSVGNVSVYYSGSATQSEAQALESSLRGLGLFNSGQGANVFLIKDGSGTTLQFVVNKDVGSQQGTLEQFAQITNAVAPKIGGKPILLKLVDSNLAPLNSKLVQ